MICGSFARARLNAGQAAEVAQGFRDNDPPPIEVRTTVADDGTFTVTAIFPPCPADTTHSIDSLTNNDLYAGAGAQFINADNTTAGAAIVFGSLVAGGFFSSQPNDHTMPRSIRTNNPGALNISQWQRSRNGFVGVTESDGSADSNRTTIYRTPEHGVASWWHLLAIIYGFSAKTSFRLLELAQHYSGRASGPIVDNYVTGWLAKAGGKFDATTDISFSDAIQTRQLARAMFDFEAGKPSPLHDDQIDYGILSERQNTLPP